MAIFKSKQKLSRSRAFRRCSGAQRAGVGDSSSFRKFLLVSERNRVRRRLAESSSTKTVFVGYGLGRPGMHCEAVEEGGAVDDDVPVCQEMPCFSRRAMA
jgi:hypothetical protein